MLNLSARPFLANRNLKMKQKIARQKTRKIQSHLIVMKKNKNQLLTYDEHSLLMRRLFVRILIVLLFVVIIVFSYKEVLFNFILAPKSADFVFYRAIAYIKEIVGLNPEKASFKIELISTELSSQFMLHLTTSLYGALLITSPYIMFELMMFIIPALYNSERKYAFPLIVSAYFMFMLGLIITYFIIFPFSFRFLGTYQVSPDVTNMISLSSYIRTFITLSFVIGFSFELPVIMWILGKKNIVSFKHLIKYRKWALMIVLILAAVITPPDIMTLIIVAGPLYMLYEASIIIVKRLQNKPLVH